MPFAELLPGNLDLVILKAVSLGEVHGYGVLLRIEQISGGAIAAAVRSAIIAMTAAPQVAATVFRRRFTQRRMRYRGVRNLRRVAAASAAENGR